MKRSLGPISYKPPPHSRVTMVQAELGIRLRRRKITLRSAIRPNAGRNHFTQYSCGVSIPENAAQDNTLTTLAPVSPRPEGFSPRARPYSGCACKSSSFPRSRGREAHAQRRCRGVLPASAWRNCDATCEPLRVRDCCRSDGFRQQSRVTSQRINGGTGTRGC